MAKANIILSASDQTRAAFSSVNSSMSGVQSAATSLKNVLGVLGVGVSVVGLFRLAKDSIDVQDGLSKMSQKVGVSVESLAGLSFAAKLSGSSIEGIEKGLKTVSAQMFDVSRGLKTSKDNFDSLGISVFDSTGKLKQADVVMIEVADRFQQMEDGTEKTALAVKLFGKSGLELIPMLNEGSAAIAQMVAEGQRLNPVTTESARQAEIYNDNLDRLKSTSGALVTTFVVGLLPSLANISESLVDFQRKVDFGSVVKLTIDVLEILTAVIGVRLVGALIKSGAAMAANVIQSIAYQSALARMAGVSTASALATTGLATATGALRGALLLVGGPIGAIVLALGALAVAYNKVQKAQQEALTGAVLNSSREGLKSLDLHIIGTAMEINKLSAAYDAELASNRVNNSARNTILMARQEQEKIMADLTVERAKVVKQLEAAEVAAIGTTQDLTFETIDLEQAALDAKAAEKLFADSMKLVADKAKDAADSIRKHNTSLLELIESIQTEWAVLQMSTREQHIYNDVKVLLTGNTWEELSAVRALSGALFDENLARKAASDAASDQARVVEKSAADRLRAEEKVTDAYQRQWESTSDWLAGTFVDIANNGRSAFQKIGDAFVAMIQRILAEWAASKIMELFGMKAPSGTGPSSLLSSIGSSAVGTVVKSALGIGTTAAAVVPSTITAASLYGAGATATVSSGAAAAGAGTAAAATGTGFLASAGAGLNAVGGTVLKALAAIPGWGWALAGAGVLATVLDKSGTESHNAGFLLRDIPGVDPSRKFDVPAFASGFDPVGFNRRSTVAEATAVIDTFRGYDAALTKMARGSGLNVDFSNAPFGAYDEKGRGDGLFFGSASEDGGGSGTALDQQLDSFVMQWIKNLSGQVDPALINDVISQGTADAMIRRASEISMIPAYEHGINYVPRTGLALLHQGERVTPASKNYSDDGLRADFQQMQIALNSLVVSSNATARALNEAIRNGEGKLAVVLA